MRRQATMMPHDCLQWNSRDIVLDTRLAPSKDTFRDVMQFRITRVDGVLNLPEGATCVLDAWRSKENLIQRVELGLAISLASPTGWMDLPKLPADSKFRETKFLLKAVSTSSRIVAICERITASQGEEAGTANLFSMEVVPSEHMGGAVYDISPDWNGNLPMQVRVSTAVPKAERRLVENDRELSLGVLAMLMPQAFMHMFPRADEDGDDEFYTAWTGFMTSHGIEQSAIEMMGSPDTEPAERGRLARHATARLVGAFAVKFEGGHAP